jgi:hypothetical protein
LVVTAMTALPSSIFSSIYAGERLAIPVPRALADDAISSVMVVAYLVSAAVATLIMMLLFSNYNKLKE